MTNAKLIQITVPQLNVGAIVHAHGARFEVLAVNDVSAFYRDLIADEVVFSCPAKWLDGAVQNGYFGPTKNWTFQGNNSATVMVEDDSEPFEEQIDSYDYDKYN